MPSNNSKYTVEMMKSNKVVAEELTLPRPKKFAIQLLNEIKDSLKLETQINEIDEVIQELSK